MSMQNEETVRLILQGTEAGVKAGDLERVVDAGMMAGIFHLDVEIIPAPELVGLAPYRGREGFIEFMHAWTEDFDDWGITLDQTIVVNEDRVVAIVRQRGTGKRSSIPIELSHGIIFEFDDRRVARIRLFATPDDAIEASKVFG